nr:hypothetical protein [Rhizobium sp. FKL33]
MSYRASRLRLLVKDRIGLLRKLLPNESGCAQEGKKQGAREEEKENVAAASAGAKDVNVQQSRS